ncbi:MAG: hypothetical protein J6T48_10875 [Bacteroidales bacterium]|nr:hypothetical protein [Bacteroidales bacterium]
MATTNFKIWIEEIDLSKSDYEEIDSLYRSVNEIGDFGLFKTESTKNGQYIVSCSTIDNKLILASEKARTAFLSIIENEYCDGNEEGWYAFHKAMEKDD